MVLYPMNYDEAVQMIIKLTVENERLKRRLEAIETQRKSTRRGRRTIINDDMIQQAREARADGLPMREIAIELGVSAYTVHKILHMNDFNTESGNSSPEKSF